MSAPKLTAAQLDCLRLAAKGELFWAENTRNPTGGYVPGLIQWERLSDPLLVRYVGRITDAGRAALAAHEEKSK